jgi:hypothetical protein
MAKRKIKHNPNLVRARRSYTFAEIAEVYGVHRRTVENWRNQGLNVIDDKSKPFLVIGADVRSFLREKQRRRKHPLKPGEFFCPRCGAPRESLQDRFSIEITERRLGRYRQAIIKGVCEVCRCRLFRFSSDKKVEELMKTGLNIAEHKTSLIGSGDSFVNTDIQRGENGKSQHQK